ncbi:MAG: zinc-binding dehydrogenase, partial [Mucilaginibacter polytrichastri]|nr:zinc-binding dehydrogenase [Mucilaginibacter polytrichastri]
AGAGPIGLAVIQFAKLAGAEVIVLDVNEHRLNFCREKLDVKEVVHALNEDVSARLSEITGGDMPTAVMDATGNLKAINASFSYLAHGGRYVLVGLQKGEISVSHPEFHKREATLLSSRNATRADFAQVISAIKSRQIDPSILITHRLAFGEVGEQFAGLLDPKMGVIKAMIDL